MRKWLRAGKTDKVITQLSMFAWELPDEAPVWTEIAYLEKHQLAGHLEYDTLRRRRLPIGSGAIESAVRRVVNLRLKGNGLLWLEENAEAVMVMRAAVLTRRWQETLEHVRLTMASDRRLDWQWKSPDMPADLKAERPIAPPLAQSPAAQGSRAAAA